ncbi:MAG TPA: site-2 protease family protein [Clostridiaceae bacterium]|nr:site-2 protease family protein [Clostridiaceae bacterium]
MISFLINAIKVIFLLGLLVFIHEGGHFLVAKLCKVKVNEFAIGFGPTIWKKQGKVTKYALRLIPLGGFVSMEGEEERSENEGSFSKASIPKRIAIVVARWYGKYYIWTYNLFLFNDNKWKLYNQSNRFINSRLWCTNSWNKSK